MRDGERRNHTSRHGVKAIGGALLAILSAATNAHHDTINFEVTGTNSTFVDEGASVTFTISGWRQDARRARP